MKITEFKQSLTEKNIEALQAELLSLLKEQFNLRLQKTVGQLSRAHTLKEVRRNIARVKTAINKNRKVS